MLRLFILILGFLVQVSLAGAQSDQPKWVDTLGTIKGDIDRIITENNQLEAEYNALKNRIVDIQTSINSHKAENQKLENDIERTQKLSTQEQLTRETLNQRLERLKQEATTSQSKVSELNAQIAEYDEKLRLWSLQVNDLELEKEQLDLELQSQEKLRSEIESGDAVELQKLKEQIAAAQGQSNEVSGATEKLADETQQSKEELERLNAENKILEEKIAELQDQKNQKIKETESWRKKAGQDVPSTHAQKMKEKKALEIEIARLESQLDSVRKAVENSAETQAKRRGLLDQIMNLDKENKELRQKISELKAKVDTIEPAEASQ